MDVEWSLNQCTAFKPSRVCLGADAVDSNLTRSKQISHDVGKSNESDINIDGHKCRALLDTG